MYKDLKRRIKDIIISQLRLLHIQKIPPKSIGKVLKLISDLVKRVKSQHKIMSGIFMYQKQIENQTLKYFYPSIKINRNKFNKRCVGTLH